MRSTVARKALMAVTGLFLVLFLLMHMFGNLKLLIPDNGAEFDEYSEALRTFLYPVLPEKFFLTCFRGVLAVAILVHLEAAIRLTFRDYDAKGGLGRYFKQRFLGGSFAARTMIWGGVIIVLGVIVHLLQFTGQIIKVNYPAGAASVLPHERVVLGFQEWWLVLLYAIWMLAVCFHVWHGFYSAFCTLGARVGAASEKVIKFCAWVVAILLYIGFMLTPVLIFLGVIFPNA
ncbi:succinate dehydrogenase cytochrome b subunit [Brooklawnia cerclae]|uniref:succinate dehydrogenase cytochrome b subunit n=1 Tax=Brooklawnia cerclae TaxID=349934 RepID=UPI00141F072B|nr:succinate dehydrogenase cytochrome b subunit [Brooklawnia cerclae]